MPFTDSQSTALPEIGAPIPTPNLATARGRYREVWERAAALREGEALPLTFATTDSAISFSAQRPKAKSLGCVIARRENVVYLVKEVTQ